MSAFVTYNDRTRVLSANGVSPSLRPYEVEIVGPLAARWAQIFDRSAKRQHWARSKAEAYAKEDAHEAIL